MTVVFTNQHRSDDVLKCERDTWKSRFLVDRCRDFYRGMKCFWKSRAKIKEEGEILIFWVWKRVWNVERGHKTAGISSRKWKIIHTAAKKNKFMNFSLSFLQHVTHSRSHFIIAAACKSRLSSLFSLLSSRCIELLQIAFNSSLNYLVKRYKIVVNYIIRHFDCFVINWNDWSQLSGWR